MKKNNKQLNGLPKDNWGTDSCYYRHMNNNNNTNAKNWRISPLNADQNA
jgi:hypothetical protein